MPQPILFKVQNLKDKSFGKVALFTPHKNPAAAIETNIRHYKRYSISRAYRGESFYWGLPQAGDFITMTLTPPVRLATIKFVSGNVEHPNDKFVATDVDVLFDRPEKGSFGAAAAVQADNFVTVASFDDNGVAEAKGRLYFWTLFGWFYFSPLHASTLSQTITEYIHGSPRRFSQCL